MSIISCVVIIPGNAGGWRRAVTPPVTDNHSSSETAGSITLGAGLWGQENLGTALFCNGDPGVCKPYLR